MAAHNARAERVAARRRAGAPGEWTAAMRAEVVRAVLSAMAEGGTLAEAASAEGVVASTVRTWLAGDPAWMAEYVAVRRLQAQAWAEEAIQVARESTNQTATKDRLLVDTLKWAASKASPGEFGDRQTVEHQGAQEIKVRVVEDEPPTVAVRRAAEGVVLAGMQTSVPLLAEGSSAGSNAGSDAGSSAGSGAG